jgi:hypothetical protein
MMPPAPDWVALRAAIGKERGWTCEICRVSPASQLHHAIVPDKRKPERMHRLLSVAANLEFICADCHDKYGRSTSQRHQFIVAQRRRGYNLDEFVASLNLKEPGSLYRLVNAS